MGAPKAVGKPPRMYNYNFHDVFSLKTNISYFDGLMHAFPASKDARPVFHFLLDEGMKVPTAGKPKVNLMLYYNPEDDSVEFNYPWVRPILAKLRLKDDNSEAMFRFNRNYLRFSGIVAEGWELIDVFRSLLLTSLIRENMYMIHGAAVTINQECILMPSFGNTGKTSTSWMLARRGAEFLTDEFAVLDSQRACFSFPCSSLLSSGSVSSVGLRLTGRQRLRLLANEAKSKVLSTRFASGGIKVYPDRIFKVCDRARVDKIVFIQNGVDSVKRIDGQEAMARIGAIQSYELNWRANPFLIAYSFFTQHHGFSSLPGREDDYVRGLVSRVDGSYVVSSSSGKHYQMVEQLVKG